MAPIHSADAPAAVAAFDLDGTLTEGGSVIHWLSAVGGRRAVRRAVAHHASTLAVGAIRSGHTADDAKEALFTEVLADRALDDVTSISAAFADEHLRAAIRPVLAARFAAHLDAGHTVVIVSASPALYVDRIASSLGAHGAAATRLAVDDRGRLTGRYEGRNCRGTEKLRRVRELLGELGVADTGAALPLFAYGNSRGDLRLLEAADRPVDASRLGKLGSLRNFPRLAEVPI